MRFCFSGKSSLVILLAVFLMVAATAPAAIAKADMTPDLVVAPAPVLSEGWAKRPALAGRPGVAYVTITNTLPQAVDDVLRSVTSPKVKKIELHTHSMDKGVMRMRRVESVAVPAGGQVEFRPGGLHLMLFGLHDLDTDTGEQLPLVFNFDKAGPVSLTIPVQ
ncbi:MAG: hypothetical protein CMF31_07035 [Kordiimonas sp.]|nr:hypothetical protein [Kordiimonas sp.]|tara:strand:- start:3830 stop:4318 length:489 start_codon:yes stop_codon:yes gene_type:complete